MHFKKIIYLKHLILVSSLVKLKPVRHSGWQGTRVVGTFAKFHCEAKVGAMSAFDPWVLESSVQKTGKKKPRFTSVSKMEQIIWQYYHNCL